MKAGLTNLTYAVIGLLSQSVFAQQPVSLEQAVQTALHKNQLIKSAEYQVEYFKQVKKNFDRHRQAIGDMDARPIQFSLPGQQPHVCPDVAVSDSSGKSNSVG